MPEVGIGGPDKGEKAVKAETKKEEKKAVKTEEKKADATKKLVAPEPETKKKAEPVPEPLANTARAAMDRGATFKQSSKRDKDWANPRLDSPTGAQISEADALKKKDFWIEVELFKPAEVYQVILMRQ